MYGKRVSVWGLFFLRRNTPILHEKHTTNPRKHNPFFPENTTHPGKTQPIPGKHNPSPENTTHPASGSRKYNQPILLDHEKHTTNPRKTPPIHRKHNQSFPENTTHPGKTQPIPGKHNPSPENTTHPHSGSRKYNQHILLDPEKHNQSPENTTHPSRRNQPILTPTTSTCRASLSTSSLSRHLLAPSLRSVRYPACGSPVRSAQVVRALARTALRVSGRRRSRPAV